MSSLIEDLRREAKGALFGLFRPLLHAEDELLDEIVTGDVTRRDYAKIALDVLLERGILTEEEHAAYKRMLTKSKT
jgi:hypothetical protein